MLYIGVCLRSIDVERDTFPPSENAWLINCRNMDMYHGTWESHRTGRRINKGDRVGVLLDMSFRTLTYYLNGKKLRYMHRDLPRTELLPCVAMGGEGEEIAIEFTSAPEE